MAKIIAIFNQKGGVGKTTTAVNLSAAVGILGKKTLIVDIDQQGNTTSGFGINKRNLTHSSYDVLMGNIEPEAAVVKTKFKNLDVIPSNRELAGAEVELINLDRRESQLIHRLPPFNRLGFHQRTLRRRHLYGAVAVRIPCNGRTFSAYGVCPRG